MVDWKNRYHLCTCQTKDDALLVVDVLKANEIAYEIIKPKSSAIDGATQYLHLHVTSFDIYVRDSDSEEAIALYNQIVCESEGEIVHQTSDLNESQLVDEKLGKRNVTIFWQITLVLLVSPIIYFLLQMLYTWFRELGK